MKTSRYFPITVCLLFILSFAAPAAGPSMFDSKEEKEGFLRALAKQDERYDPQEKMIEKPYSSPGYHTTLKSGTVHPTRDSLDYAVALLDSGDAQRLERAIAILHRVIDLQDQDPKSRTYGIWSWFMEEPLDKMAPPDWNWADFCGTQLLQAILDHGDRLPEELRVKIRESILHAARAIKKRNVGPGYTNIALMGAYVTLTAGERFGDNDLRDYGKARVKRFYDYTHEKGSFSEYNSPTYSIVAIEEISRMLLHVRDADSRRLLDELNRFAWRHASRRFHPPTLQWGGPHSRCYQTLLPDSKLAFIQRATDGRLSFVKEGQASESLNAHRVRARCPEDFDRFFTKLEAPRTEIEAFVKNAADKHDIIGTTYLHPDFVLGTVNIGDLWNQRRSLLGYWKTDGGVVAMRLRCLHDGYDYSSASFFSTQKKGSVLSAVTFATDRGDTHISIDKIKNGAIRAKDLRVRLQFEGDARSVRFTGTPGGSRQSFVSGTVRGAFDLRHVEFPRYGESTDSPRVVQTDRNDKETWMDVVLYQGEERVLDFQAMERAIVALELSLAPVGSTADTPQRETDDVVIKNDIMEFQTGSGMKLGLSIRPCKTRDQSASAFARLDGRDPWKAQPHGENEE